MGKRTRRKRQIDELTQQRREKLKCRKTSEIPSVIISDTKGNNQPNLADTVSSDTIRTLQNDSDHVEVALIIDTRADQGQSSPQTPPISSATCPVSPPAVHRTPPNQNTRKSPVCNPLSYAYRKRRLFSMRSPKTFTVMKGTRTYSKYATPAEVVASPKKIPPRPTGRRLLTIDALNTLIENILQHARTCYLPRLKIVKEIRKGLHTIVIAVCRTCNGEVRLDNDVGDKTLQINEAAVWAGNATGSGFTSLKHSLTVLDVPFLSPNNYFNLERKFGADLQIGFDKLIQKHGEEELQMAVDLGQIDQDGMPWTDVIGDGQWSKRAFNQQGKALSGSAVLIGALTKKPLFVGVRNKVCYVCTTQPGKDHTCFRNYDGSSSGMESSIIREGFEKSVDMHGLRYKHFIGDGDSSVFMNIKDVYLNGTSYFTSVSKITCKLHAIRAMNRNLLIASKNSNKNSGYPKQIRDCLTERIHKFGKYANHIIQRHIEMRPSTNCKTLAQDLKALPRHLFGLHDSCSTIICKEGKLITPSVYKKPTATRSVEYKTPPKAFFESPLWTEITDVCKRLSDLSPSLLYNMNTNLAEHFQAHINKFAQGRRCNNVMRGGYNRKVQEAAYSFTFGPSWYVNFFEESKFDTRLLPLWHKVQKEEISKKDHRSQKPPAKRFKGPSLGNNQLPPFFSRSRKPDGDKDYGPNAQQEDMDDEVVDFYIQKFLAEKEVDSLEEQWQIHLDTIGQHENPNYKRVRYGLITASIIGDLVGLRDSTPNVSMIDKIINPPDLSDKPAIKWGLLHEKKARKLYEKLKNVAVDDAGLFISTQFTALAGSPDGLVGNEGIIEIKCPYNERYVMPDNVSNRKTNAYLQKRKEASGEDVYSLKKSSHYYQQIVQQLHVTQRKWCDFVVWTQGTVINSSNTSELFPVNPEGHLISIRIFRDCETEKKFDIIMEKSQRFFYEDLGPELVNSRLQRNMGYRQPAYRMNAITALKTKKNQLSN